MSTLLERAKQVSTRKTDVPVSQEEIDLAFGWLTGEVALAQVVMVLYPDTPRNKTTNVASNATRRLAMFLRAAYARGQLTLTAPK